MSWIAWLLGAALVGTLSVIGILIRAKRKMARAISEAYENARKNAS